MQRELWGGTVLEWQEPKQRACLFSGLLCFVAGITIAAMHHLNSDLLKAFFDLREDKEEEFQEMPEVFVNPHFVNKRLSPQPSEINSI